MTNFEKWRLYTSSLTSPDNFVNWGWYYLIAAALQRRVWCPPNHQRCYPNMYVTLVGPPGVGKGLVTNKILEILRHHKLEDVIAEMSGKNSKITDAEKAMASAIQNADLKVADEHNAIGKSKDANSEKALLFPIASDAVTFEALVQSMAGCYRRVNYTEFDSISGKDILKIYGHSSQCFCLDEISSLFRKKTEDVVNFLLQAYNCVENYEYRTKTQGKDRIRRICLNFMGGTTPDFMQSTFDDELLNQGFSSRTFYIYASKNRFSQFFMPELTEEQRQAKQEIIDHIKHLYGVFGAVIIDDETRKYLEDWVKYDHDHPNERINKSQKLVAYYARKVIHIMKVAMAIHFGECLDMHIPLETFKRAIKILEEAEKDMHYALTLEGDNPLAKTSRKLLEYLGTSGAQTFQSLMIEFWGKVNKEDMEKILTHLLSVDQITVTEIENPVTHETKRYYKIK